MKNLSRFRCYTKVGSLHVLFLFFCLFSTSVVAAPPCPILLEKMAKIFALCFNDTKAFSGGLCLYNSGEIARLLSKEMEGEIDPSEIRILVFRHKDHSTISKIPSDSRLIVGVHTYNGRKSLWFFHSVIEYRGQILDLEYGNEPKIVPLEQYVKTMFPPVKAKEIDRAEGIPAKYVYNDPKDLTVTPIPATAYFDRFTPKQYEKVNVIAYDYPRVPMDSFIRSLSE